MVSRTEEFSQQLKWGIFFAIGVNDTSSEASHRQHFSALAIVQTLQLV